MYSDEEIVAKSELSVKSITDVSSPRLGTGEGVYCSICERPEICIGHSGHIVLKGPIFHPLYVKEMMNFLKILCFKCSKLRNNCNCGSKTPRIKFCSPNSIQGPLFALAKTIPDEREYYVECDSADPKNKSLYNPGSDAMKWNEKHQSRKILHLYAKDVLEIFVKVPKEERVAAGIAHPERFICSVIPVVPNCVRTSVDSFDVVTKTYQRIVLSSSLGSIFDKYSQLLGVQGGSRRKTEEMESLKSFKDKMTGKMGFFRKYSLGKRNDNCARAVISPDPSLSIGKVGVPKDFAMFVYTSTNDKRKLTNGDTVILNRQPSLQRHSLLAFNVELTNNKTITINPAVCSAFNADFDGDEMNIFCPSTLKSIAEARELMSPEACFISPQNNSPVFYPILDSVSCMYIMSTMDLSRLFTDWKCLFFDCLTSIDWNAKQSSSKGTCWAKELLEVLGIREERCTKESLKKIAQTICTTSSSKEALLFVEKCQIVSSRIMYLFGLSIGYDTCRELVRPRTLLTDSDTDEEAIVKKLLRRNEHNALMISCQSGAKGSIDNVVQITCCVGEQHVPSKHSPYKDISLDGFCTNSFMSGLNPAEYFIHAQAGREGVINTSMRTPKSGYIHRRLARALEDCIVEYDGTVRSDGKIIRF